MPRKVRFTIRVGEQQSELFSVRETTQGDLIIILKADEQLAHSPMSQEFHDITESRFTIHNSPNSEGTTINYHSSFEVDPKRSTSTFMRPRHGRLRWPIHHVLCTDLSGTYYASKPRISDEIISIDAYNPNYCSLVYHIVITMPGDHFQLPSYNTCRKEFINFVVHIFWSFNGIPSFHQGAFLGLSTTEPSIGDEKGRILVHNARSFRLLRLRQFLQAAGAKLGIDHAARVLRWIEGSSPELSNPKRRAQIIELSQTFYLRPPTPI